jgi:hypothetical protein
MMVVLDLITGRIVMCGATGYHTGHAMNAVVWYSDNAGSSYTGEHGQYQYTSCDPIALPRCSHA